MPADDGSGQRVLLLRHGRLGENLTWTSVPAALRRARPRLEVHVLTNRPMIWEGNPHVASIHALPGDVRGAGAAGRLDAALGPHRGTAFEAAIFSNEGPAVAEAMVRLGVTRHLRSPEWDRLPGGDPRPAARAAGFVRVHRAAAAVAHAAPLGVGPPPWPMAFHVPDGSRAAAAETLRRAGFPGGVPLLAMNMGSDQSRRLLRRRPRSRTWPAGRLVECARGLAAAPGFGEARFFLNQFSLRDWLAARRVAAALPPGRTLHLPRSADLRTVAGILLRCDALVSSDTGMLHLGLALGVPTVGIFGDRIPPSFIGPLGPGSPGRMFAPPPGGTVASIPAGPVVEAVVALASRPPGRRNGAGARPGAC